MDVFQVRKERLAELGTVERALVRLEDSLPAVPCAVWVEHALLSVRRHQLAMGVSLDRELVRRNYRREGGGR